MRKPRWRVVLQCAKCQAPVRVTVEADTEKQACRIAENQHEMSHDLKAGDFCCYAVSATRLEDTDEV